MDTAEGAETKAKVGRYFFWALADSRGAEEDEPSGKDAPAVGLSAPQQRRAW